MHHRGFGMLNFFKHFAGNAGTYAGKNVNREKNLFSYTKDFVYYPISLRRSRQ